MILIPIVCLMLGVLLGILVSVPLHGLLASYLAVCCLAGIDTVCGGIRSALEKKFYSDIFITGFVSNVVIAFSLAWIGDRIGLDLFLAIAIILGGRIFTNLSLIRRYVLTWWHDYREERRETREVRRAPQAQMEKCS